LPNNFYPNPRYAKNKCKLFIPTLNIKTKENDNYLSLSLNGQEVRNSPRIQCLPTERHPLAQPILIKRALPDIRAQLLHVLQVRCSGIACLLVETLQHLLAREGVRERLFLRLVEGPVVLGHEGDVAD